jgi:hypothetical protein
MTLYDFILKCDQLKAALESGMQSISDEVALNALALVKNRIIDKRKGIPGAAYSTNPMLATKDQFVVKSAFKISKVDDYIIKRNKQGKPIESKSGRSYKTKKVKRELWIKFPKASKAVPVMLLEKGYKEFREIQGRPGDHVNLSLTGHMWKATTITARSKNDNGVWITIIGGYDKEAQDKLIWMTEKYGQFLAVEPDEKDLLADLYKTRLQSLYDSVFLA